MCYNISSLAEVTTSVSLVIYQLRFHRVNAIATSMSPNNSQCSDRENVQCSSSLTSERRRPSDDFELNRRIVQGWRNR